MNNKVEMQDVSVVRITPELARHLLSKNYTNRKMSQSRVSFYARQMIDGEWIMNGQGIIVSNSGNLLDGQHRLMAVAQSGKSVDMLKVVLKGSSDNLTALGMPIDRGKPRTMRDVTGLDSRDVQIVQAIIRILFPKKGNNFSVNDVEDLYLVLSSDIDNFFNMVGRSNKKGICSAGVRAALCIYSHLYGFDDNQEMYRFIVKNEYHRINEKWSNWLKKIDSFKRESGNHGQYMPFVYTWLTLKDLSNKRVTDHQIDFAISDAQLEFTDCHTVYKSWL